MICGYLPSHRVIDSVLNQTQGDPYTANRTPSADYGLASDLEATYPKHRKIAGAEQRLIVPSGLCHAGPLLTWAIRAPLAVAPLDTHKIVSKL